MTDSTDTQLQLTEDSLSKLCKPWDQLPGEPDEAYNLFHHYLMLGPRRSVTEAVRRVLIEANELLPGQPLRRIPTQALRFAARYSWRARAHAWDQLHWQKERELYEEMSRTAIIEMVNRQIEGWQIIAEAAIANFFERDPETGAPLLDEEGRPKVRVIEDEGVALRAFRQAVAGERTARGLPAELVVMSTEDIKQRLVDLNRKVSSLQAEEEVVDADFVELEAEDDEED